MKLQQTKKSLMGIVCRVLWKFSKTLVNCFVWNHQYFEKLAPKKSPWEFYHRFMYIAPSSDHSLLTLNLPFKVILRRFEVVLDCLEWEGIRGANILPQPLIGWRPGTHECQVGNDSLSHHLLLLMIKGIIWSVGHAGSSPHSKNKLKGTNYEMMFGSVIWNKVD